MASLRSMSSRSHAAAKAISGMQRPGGVVGELEVAPEPARLVVERLAHDAEVLLGGVGAAVPLGGGAVRDVVEERLGGGADHRDDVGAGLGRRPGLLHVVVDVAGGDDQVLVGPRARPQLGLERVAARPPARCSSSTAARASRASVLAQRPLLGGRQRRRPLRQAGDGLDDGGRVARPLPHDVAEPPGGAAPQQAAPVQLVHHQVHLRDAARPGAVEAEEPQHRPLDGHGGVAVDEAEHRRRHLVGQRAAAGHLVRIEVEVGDLAAVGEEHGARCRPRQGGRQGIPGLTAIRSSGSGRSRRPPGPGGGGQRLGGVERRLVEHQVEQVAQPLADVRPGRTAEQRHQGPAVERQRAGL